MKSFIRVITIIVVLNLLLACSATAQTASATVPTAPTAVSQQVVSEVNKTLDSRLSDWNGKYIQLNIARAGRFGGEGILVIPTAEIKPQDMVTLMEDMTIMCRIFDKKSTQSYPTTGRYRSSLGFSMPFSRDSRSIKAMYVQGYGALFLTTVDFPLSPPPQTEEKEETKEEDADPVWEQTKQEMFSPQEASRRTPERPEENYDADKVENLKTTLIKALKHAANIRALKPDESVILTVTGSGISSNVDKIVMNKNNQLLLHTKNRNIVQILGSPSLSDLGISSPTVLTIRAKKADIDAFAKGQLSFDQFTQKTLLLSYSYLGENIGVGPSPSSRTNVIYGERSTRRSRR